MNDERLPLDGYDQMTVEKLRHAIRTLARDDLQRLLEYEQGHADRPLVKEIMTTRLDELAAGAEPTAGEPPQEPPSSQQPRTPSEVQPDTQAEPIIPPAHGVPTTHRPRQGPRR